jgi:transcription-repair coupling factor (superfamily II helicase)
LKTRSNTTRPEDQAQAIADVKRDMESQLPMDRLLCGDVGYGKTEVAMRAAFKALSDNKQVAVLAPTTVLAFQHYETFKQRFAPFPLTVEMISRFRTPKQVKEMLQRVAGVSRHSDRNASAAFERREVCRSWVAGGG